MPIHDWTRVPAGIFHDFHSTWIPDIKRALNAGALPYGYYALVEQITGRFEPDVLTLERRNPAAEARGDISEGNAPGLVTLQVAPPKVRFSGAAEEDRYAIKAKALTIRHISEDNVVAVVEIVSPGNKSSRHAIRSFVDKSVGLIRAGVHLLVVDLFPPGRRDPHGIHNSIWSEISDDGFHSPSDEPLTLASFAAGETKRIFVEPVAVGESLIDMPLFLEQDAYVSVPLEASYISAFATVPDRWREVLEAERAEPHNP